MARIILEDEALRDGLQSEAKVFTLDQKVVFFHKLVEAGLRRIQVGSFVHPKYVPQMTDTDEFVQHVKDTPGVLVTGLILNDRGLERALAMANLVAGYEAGVEIFDVATGGLGGCPFVKGAAGNLPTEDVVNLCDQMGIESGVDLEGLCQAVDLLSSLLGKELPGRMCKVVKCMAESGG